MVGRARRNDRGYSARKGLEQGSEPLQSEFARSGDRRKQGVADARRQPVLWNRIGLARKSVWSQFANGSDRGIDRIKPVAFEHRPHLAFAGRRIEQIHFEVALILAPNLS